MARPTLLVAEAEPEAALSVRKLVLETAKFNVLTAHSSEEAVELFHVNPALSGAIFSSQLTNVKSVVKEIKAKDPDLPVIYLSPTHIGSVKDVDHILSSHDPEALVELCRELFGDPRKIKTQKR
jgi:DNA-binding response OmpR family regulator